MMSQKSTEANIVYEATVSVKSATETKQKEHDQTTPVQHIVIDEAINESRNRVSFMAAKLSNLDIIKKLSTNINFFIAVFIYVLCMFLGVICIFYGLGQITQLELTNYWCDKKDLNTIHQHSWENNLNEGTNDGCWKSKLFTVKYLHIILCCLKQIKALTFL